MNAGAESSGAESVDDPDFVNMGEDCLVDVGFQFFQCVFDPFPD